MATGATAPHIPASALLPPAVLRTLRQPVEWKSLALVAHAWAVILGSMALVAWWPNPLSFLLAVVLIGSRQLGLAILMHDGAHGCLSGSKPRNRWISQLFCAWPVFADTDAYRRYHLRHHAHTQQPDDPDLVLSAPFPITRASYRRKFWRDISGQTGLQQRRAQFANALGDAAWPWRRRALHFWHRLGPQCAVNAALFAALALAGLWWAYPLLWLLPMLTWMMVITRIRNIAEHAVVPDGNDALRNTRTTRANWLERALVAPYFVNYHLEHHLLHFIPCHALPRLHRILMAGPHASRMEVRSGYAEVLRLATAKAAAEDARGAIVNNARRLRQGHGDRDGVRQDQASAGF